MDVFACASIFAFLLIYDVSNVNPFGMLGPAETEIKTVVTCPEYAGPNRLSGVRRRVNRTHFVLDMDIVLPTGLQLDDGLYVNGHRWGDGGYKPNFMVFNESSVCKFVMHFAHDILTDMLSKIGQPPACPIKPNHYILNDYTIDISKFPQEGVYGDYKAVAMITRGSQVIVCLHVFILVKPKKMLQG